MQVLTGVQEASSAEDQKLFKASRAKNQKIREAMNQKLFKTSEDENQKLPADV